MAEPTDRTGVVADVTQAASLEVARRKRDSKKMDRNRRNSRVRRIEAVALRLEGRTYAEIGAQLSISWQSAHDLVSRSLSRAENVNAEQLREIENARLDKAQVAIWPQVLDGDLKAVETFLRISARRAKLNGLDAPTAINISLGVRQEMEAALLVLERTVLGDAGMPEISDPDAWDQRGDEVITEVLPDP
jgi:hypothetical protein